MSGSPLTSWTQAATKEGGRENLPPRLWMEQVRSCVIVPSIMLKFVLLIRVWIMVTSADFLGSVDPWYSFPTLAFQFVYLLQELQCLNQLK